MEEKQVATHESLAENSPSVDSAVVPTPTEQVVTPWEVTSTSDKGIDYDKLTEQFGCEKITEDLIARFERVTGRQAHVFLRRGLFFAHRDLDRFLDAKEKGEPVYLYTGRGPASDALHLGHLIPFMFTKFLMEAFDCPLVIQMTDDEKFLFKEHLELEDTHRMLYENVKDILAVGIPPEKVFIFSDWKYYGTLVYNILRIQKKLPFNQVKGIFGFDESDNIGKIAFPATQAAPCFSSSFPGLFGENHKPIICLIPCAIDQDPYFRMTRDIAPRLGELKPCEILSQFIPSLEGAKQKMSGSISRTTITCQDSKKEIEKKIMKYAFSGGQTTVEEHRLKGGNLEIDVPYQFLRFLLDDDSELKRIGDEYSSGQMLTGEIKKILATHVSQIIEGHQIRRAQITQETVEFVMNPHRPELLEKYKGREKEVQGDSKDAKTAKEKKMERSKKWK